MENRSTLPNTWAMSVLNGLLFSAISLMLVLYLLRRRTRIVTAKLFAYYRR